MAYLSDEDITKVRDATDIVALVGERVALKQRGRQWWGCCPFHQEKTPSFKVDPASGLWYCFGCSEGGNAFTYVMRTEGMEFTEAARFLAERAHIELKVDPRSAARKAQTDALRAVCAETARWYNEQLLRVKGAAQDSARAYLSKRGFGTQVATDWQLGYAPGLGQLVAHLKSKGFKPADMVTANVAFERGGIYRDRFYERVMFPITDLQGRPIAFGGRVIEGLSAAPDAGMPAAKYLNSNDTPIFHKSDHFYGIARARRSIIEQSCALVVEGYTDVIALHAAGFTTAVATLGTALNAAQVRLLSRFAKRIVYIFDGDEAGQKAADRAVEFIEQIVMPEFASNPLQLDVVLIPGGADPAELVASEQGRERMQGLIDSASSLFEFAIERRLKRWDLKRPEQRQSALRDAAEVVASLQGSLLGSDYAQLIADKLAAKGSTVELRQVLAEIEAAARRRERQAATSAPRGGQPGAGDGGGAAASASRDGDAPEGQPLPEEEQASRSVTSVLADPVSPGVSNQQDLLALLLFFPELRQSCWEDFSPDLFTEPAYRTVAEALCSYGPDTPQQKLDEELLKSFPSLPVLAEQYGTIRKSESALEARTKVLMQQLHEAKLQSEIIQLRTRMRTSQDSDMLFETLIERERKLQELRAKRYN
ncbi:MAG: DNA primase [Coriobacteriia bacterium]|nr:DNA primase [Coriobacteriia bacterium]